MHSACAALYFHLWLVLLCHVFQHCVINGMILGQESYWIWKVFWFSLQVLTETFIVVRKLSEMCWYMYSVGLLQVKYRYCQILWNFKLLDRFWKNTKIRNLMKIHAVNGELSNGDGRTDRRTHTMKLIDAFRNFANASKNRD